PPSTPELASPSPQPELSSSARKKIGEKKEEKKCIFIVTLFSMPEAEAGNDSCRFGALGMLQHNHPRSLIMPKWPALFSSGDGANLQFKKATEGRQLVWNSPLTQASDDASMKAQKEARETNRRFFSAFWAASGRFSGG